MNAMAATTGTTTLIDVERQLTACRNVAELRQRLESLCLGLAEILNVTLICTSKEATQKLCVVDLIPGNTDIQTCAHRLGGRVFGHSAIILELIPHPEFFCSTGFRKDAPDCICVPK